MILFNNIITSQDLPGLVSFLNSRFVNNPVIALQYAHSTVPGSYGAGYEGELRRFTLKKVNLEYYVKSLLTYGQCSSVS